jgi:enoyl-CoA hydratase/carnithine racemase
MSEPVARANVEPKSLVQVNLDKGLMTIRLGHVNNGYLWTLELMDNFCDLIQAVSQNSDVRVLVIESSGVDFCKGLLTSDFPRTSTNRDPNVRTTLDRFEQCCHRDLALLPQPVIAKVQGLCHFAGVQLLEGCDIVFAAEDAQFIVQGQELLLMSSDWEQKSHKFQRLAGDQPKTYVTRIENTYDTSEAQRLGLVTFSFLPEVLSQEVETLAISFCEKDALALQFTKETVAHVPSMTWDASVNFTAAKFAELKSRQAGETSTRATAVASFLAGKTKPGKGA